MKRAPELKAKQNFCYFYGKEEGFIKKGIMQKQNRIVALLDFSESSGTILHFTDIYSDLLDAEILLFHQISKFIVPSLADEGTRREVGNFEKEKALKKLRDISLEFLPEKKLNLKVSEQDLLISLNELKQDGYLDWLFMGIKEPNSWAKKLLGSTITRIINNTNFLTLAIPQQASQEVTKNFTLAFSYKFKPNQPVLDQVLENLIPHLNKIRFINIVTENDDKARAMEFLEDLQDHYSRKIESCSLKIFKGKDAFEEVQSFIKKRKSILVVQKGSRDFTDQLFRKFFINELIAVGHIPILVLPQ